MDWHNYINKAEEKKREPGLIIYTLIRTKTKSNLEKFNKSFKEF